MKYRDYTINSYVAYCFRQINKYGFSPFSKIGVMHTYIKILEQFADKCAALFVGVGDKKIEIDATTIFKDILEMYKTMQRIRSRYSQEKLNEIEEQRAALLNDLPKMHVHVKLYVTEILELIYDLEELETQLQM